jgi:hypothetical protein
MSETAPIFTATYADWKVIKTRQMVQVVFEIPIGAERHAYNILGGMPNHGKEAWFAIARLKEKPKDETP